MKAKILGKKQRRALAEKLSCYGLEKKAFDDVELITMGVEIFACSRELLTSDLTELNLRSIGLRVLNNMVPTIAGIQLLFKTARLNELAMDAAQDFISSKKIPFSKGIPSYGGHPIDLGKKTGDFLVRR